MMPSMMKSPLLVLLVAMILHVASAGFKLTMDADANTVRNQDRDPFKEPYFNMILTCFVLMFFFVFCMFGVRLCLGKRRGNDSQSFFLVA